MNRKPPDWTKTGTIAGYAKYLREQAGALAFEARVKSLMSGRLQQPPRGKSRSTGGTMRVNVYAEEMTDRVEIISKRIDGHEFTGLRFYLELPATINLPQLVVGQHLATTTVRGPFIHRPGDDDSSAVTFWGKQDFRDLLRQALQLLDEHYRRAVESEQCAVEPEHEDCASERGDFDARA